jgi:hypothetical protein
MNLFFAAEDVRFGDGCGVKSVAFLVNNCLITDVRLLLVVGFCSSRLELIFSFDGDEIDSFDFIFD